MGLSFLPFPGLSGQPVHAVRLPLQVHHILSPTGCQVFLPFPALAGYTVEKHCRGVSQI
ncbi:hypothetical protein BACCAP_02379 [Pseudoflavonifractor capillosus ATCC 29799]|uniref:Uncharacterized protein n=1 Tax=Pseudoflavonifractor capillosus ATCC 29799 TaxID=411467 RepID=A6NVY5_9FIRM|nr:hypothetical protein BACCAP_02379 [Pseudoflavonifractor capillosus ATCC 29799]